MHDVSGQTKVTDLHNLPLGQKDIAGSQVPVDTLRGKEKKKKKASELLQLRPGSHQDSCKTGKSGGT